MSVRFAPSPTGRFHVGNLRTAWVSHQLARAAGMRWILRFEDIDRPRVLVGARELQLLDMKALGLVADSDYLQSTRHERHWRLLEAAVQEGSVYPCSCSRKEVREAIEGHASAPHSAPPIYSGRCRGERYRGEYALNPSAGWRFRNPKDASGARDFLVGRGGFSEAEFVPSYNWACAIDDLDGGYRLLVRASDLAEVAAQQQEVQRWMRASAGATGELPAIFHCALVTRDDGSRLEKRTRGATLPELEAAGFGADRLVDLFERSFELPLNDLSAGALTSEKTTEISLSKLGLVLPK